VEFEDQITTVGHSARQPRSPLEWDRTRRELIGKRVADEVSARAIGVEVDLDQDPLLRQVDLSSEFLPCYLSGRITGDIGGIERQILAIAVNGIVRGLTKAYDDGAGGAGFFAMVAEESFRSGFNRADVFLVSHDDGKARLESIAHSTPTHYSISSTAAGEVILRSEGEASVSVIPDAVEGHLDGFAQVDGRIRFSGWAADLGNGTPATSIVFFANGDSFFVGPPHLPRPDVARARQNQALLYSGFRFSFPIAQMDDSKIRIFALSPAGEASELRYPDDYSWR
jgi:hypothetical protein